MAKSDKANPSKGKRDKTKGGKKAAKKGKGEAVDGISVAGHPRAAAQVRKAKGLGGIGFFAVAAYLSYKAGVPSDQVALRALAFGIAGYLLAWACSVTVWRHLVLAELRGALEAGPATSQSTDPVAPGGPAPEAGKPGGEAE